MAMRNYMIGLVSAAFLATAGSAAAATYEVGDLTALTAGEDGGWVGSIAFATGSFNDVFNFSLSSQSDFGAFISRLATKPNQLLSSFAGVLSGPAGFSQSFNFAQFGSTVQSLDYTGLLGAGNYSLSVSGVAGRGGFYAAQLQAAPVPELDSYLMLLGGLGMLGVVMRRRRHTQPS
ncbi:hypothetical protein CKO20_00900 [Rhodocyclus tenuis]|nr:hypothetical protein [Rhodocyclus tenuis]